MDIPHTVLPYKAGYVFNLPFGDSSVTVVLLNARPPHWKKDTLGQHQGSYFMKGELPASLGQVELLRKHLGAGYLTHEFTHVLFAYMETQGWQPNDEYYEDACYAIGDAVALFWNKYFSLYPEEVGK